MRSLSLFVLVAMNMLLGCSSEPELDTSPEAREQRRQNEQAAFEREMGQKQ
ncbi:MAG: hypothetical protein R3C10_14055 [Pirellulales bacterium]|nr:hypothetical protein [Planctomycetales bacterium]